MTFNSTFQSDHFWSWHHPSGPEPSSRDITADVACMPPAIAVSLVSRQPDTHYESHSPSMHHSIPLRLSLIHSWPAKANTPTVHLSSQSTIPDEHAWWR
jgi:hypothetical protein